MPGAHSFEPMAHRLRILMNRTQHLSPTSAKNVSRLFVCLAALITSAAVLVPLNPAIPLSGLDASWVYALNEAVAQGFVFGRDIVFTFGPYSFLYSWSYHPATEALALGGGAFLALTLWVCLVLLVRDLPWWWGLWVCVCISGQASSRDAILLFVPILVALAFVKVVFIEERDTAQGAWVLTLLASFGLMALVKGTVLFLCVGVTALIAISLFVIKRWGLALVSLLIPAISLAGFWLLAKQPLAALPDFFDGIWQISAGYSAAMADPGDSKEVVLLFLCSVAVLYWIAKLAKTTRSVRTFLFFLYGMFMFLAFKAGVVRHDSHAIIGSSSLVLGIMALGLLIRGKRFSSLLIFSLLLSSLVNFHYRVGNMFQQGYNAYASAYEGVSKRITDKGWLENRFFASVSELRHQGGFPVAAGTADIYPWDQSLLIASGNRWSPRPVLQSYSAYSPRLVEKNRQHLLGPRGSETIYFTVKSIDDRIPSSEDGASWPVLLARYRQDSFVNDFVVLKRISSSLPEVEFARLGGGQYSLGESIPVPKSDNPIWVSINLQPTIWGRIIRMLYKNSRLVLNLTLEDGKQRKFRFIPIMSHSGFVLSPLIEDAHSFAMLYTQDFALRNMRVKEMSISNHSGETLQWQNGFSIEFSEMIVYNAGGM